jgi:hypothetical protein
MTIGMVSQVDKLIPASGAGSFRSPVHSILNIRQGRIWFAEQRGNGLGYVTSRVSAKIIQSPSSPSPLSAKIYPWFDF